MIAPRRAAAAVLVVSLGAGVSGCAKNSSAQGPTSSWGGAASSASSSSASGSTSADPPSAAELVKQLKSTALAVKSARLSGHVKSGGDILDIDLVGNASGSNQRVVVKSANQGTATFVTAGGKTYLKGDKKFLTSTAGSQAARVIGAKYIVVPGGSSGMSDMTIGAVMTSMFKDVYFNRLDSMNTRVEKTVTAGVPSYTLSDRIGGDGTRVVVSADGKATLMKVALPDGQSLSVSEWNSVKPIVAPPTSQVIRL